MNREFTHLLDRANALSAMSHAGKWPINQARAMKITLSGIGRAARNLETMLDEDR